MHIKFEDVTYTYMLGSPFEKRALNGVDVSISSGSFTAVVGSTGSGKSTLMQHINGLLVPTSGQVTVGSTVLQPGVKRKVIKPLRKKVGMVFQYPEHQLFGSTVEEDILFGPIQHGMSVERVKRRLPELLNLVGLHEDYLHESPFQLSGGQMRRVAIAGVLATEPEVLILDEPAAGLDPSGHRALLQLFRSWHEEHGLTTVLVTHDMEDAANYADDVIVMNEGSVKLKGKPIDVFREVESLTAMNLAVPPAVRIGMALRRSNWSIDVTNQSSEQLAEQLMTNWPEKGGH
ncbi:energy-coupling factor transporter ATPase [Geomicrobium sp. JCM 19038]|uniref:energy-coupling factor transporter ATPase n=1 Tax=Geomicrobium sp. JCM 19038 TaxID=1460635 RepID=UPI0005A9126E|nr:energy-coupling factor transporter ATPase [Geomicrobium sp. JCM 19038]